MNKKVLLLALAFPLLILAGITVYKHIKVTIGREIILPISGFDPRDLLSGHFLTYRIDYKTINDNVCDYRDTDGKAYICLMIDDNEQDAYRSSMHAYDSAQTIEDRTDSCTAIIKGKCSGGRFTADIEKFFIPEASASALDRAVRNKQGKIVLSVTKNGNAAIKDLLIDGKSWKEYKDKKNIE